MVNTTGNVTGTGGNGHKVGADPRTSGVIKLTGGQGLPERFITPGKTFDEALSNTTIRDQNQIYNIIQLHNQMLMFNKKGKFKDEIQALVNILNGINSLNGFGRSLAAMVGTGVYLPEGAGIKLSKDEKKALNELQRMRFAQKDNGGDRATGD